MRRLDDIARFSYSYDATGLFAWPGYLSPADVAFLAQALDGLGWAQSSFPNTQRIDDIVRRSASIRDVAQDLFTAEWLDAAMTYPHRLIESYAIQRDAGGSLPLHGGATERLTRAGHPNAEDISCMYLFRGLLTFPWVGEWWVHRGSGGQRSASESIARAIRASGL